LAMLLNSVVQIHLHPFGWREQRFLEMESRVIWALHIDLFNEISGSEKGRLPSHRHIDTFSRRRVNPDTQRAMSEQDERIWTRRYKDVCQNLVQRIAQNRTGRVGVFAKTEGKFSCQAQPDEIGRTSASAEVITTGSWRSRQQLHQERKGIAE